jgi:hypothetical protein
MKQCSAEFSVPVARKFCKPRKKNLGLTRDQLRYHAIVKPRKKLPVSGEVSAVEKRDRKFRIIRIDAIAFAQRPARGTQL